MKYFLWSMVALTFLLLFSTAVCGLWLKFGPAEAKQAANLTFHMTIGLATVLVAAVTVTGLLLRH